MWPALNKENALLVMSLKLLVGLPSDASLCMIMFAMVKWGCNLKISIYLRSKLHGNTNPWLL